MKKALLIVSVLALAGCAHQPLPPEEEMPKQKLVADDKVYSMSRLEVVNAIKDLKGLVDTLTQKNQELETRLAALESN